MSGNERPCPWAPEDFSRPKIHTSDRPLFAPVVTVPAAQRIVKLWFDSVVRQTCTPMGEPLRLRGPSSDDSPFHPAMTWEMVETLVGKDRDLVFNRDVDEASKRLARLSILFLFMEASTFGLSADDKKRIYNLAVDVWSYDREKAKGLAWVLEYEYPGTREGSVLVYPDDDAEDKAKDFMIYSVVYPPPIFITP